MTGWYEADKDGTPVKDEDNQLIAFDFDAPITKDMHVVAEWEATTTQNFNYNIYYVTEENPGKDNQETIKINTETGEMVEEPAESTDNIKTYYVIEKDIRTNQPYVQGTTLNLRAKKISGYFVSDKQAIALPLDDPSKTYNAVFFYHPNTAHKYTVQYVEAGTEDKTPPTIVKQIKNITADQVVTAAKEQLAGYKFVNKSVDKTYTPISDYKDLKWLDASGAAQDISTLTGNSIPETVTFLVQPITYTITYSNQLPETANSVQIGSFDAALSAVTAENTPAAGNTADKNPTLYTVKDGFTLKNPSMVYADGKAYEFSHWSLGDGTTEKQITKLRGGGSNPDEYKPLTVSQGTIGNLTFVAHWKAVDPQPPQEQTGSLTVSKTVTGNLGDKNQAFNFRVTLTGASVTGTFGDMTFNNSVAEFTLRHGESKTAAGLPAGLSYEVEETDNDGYTVSAAGEEGTIQANGSSAASFTNHKSTGGTTPTYTTVTVKKVWKLDDGRKAADSVQVALLKNGAVEKTVTLSEANNWTYTWSGLALGNLWSVQELDVPEGFDSTVQQIGTALIITNDDNPVKPDDPDKPDKPTNPDKPDKPDKPTKPAKPVKPEDPNHSMVPDDGMIPGGASGSGMPQTGDVNNMSLYILLFTASLAALAGIGVYLRGRKKNKK